MSLLKEKTTDSRVLSSSELISGPAVFDLDRAARARSIVEVGLPDYLPALKLAVALTTYNLGGSDLEQDLAFVKRRYSRLIKQEIEASYPANKLPTIGFEVESPRKLFDFSKETVYKNFFDTIGLPRNKVNDQNVAISFWEFSPPPSYTAAIQKLILHELITGRFIQSLRFSQDPRKIREFLDDKLVSLHVNLGIPASVKTRSPLETPDVKVFASSFALAFSSSLRLQHRNRPEYFDTKGADYTRKSMVGKSERIELKALEVRDKSVYRLIEEVQMLGAALFARIGGYDKELALAWDKAKARIQQVYSECGFEPHSLTLNKEHVANLVEATGVGRDIRRIITQGVRAAKMQVYKR